MREFVTAGVLANFARMLRSSVRGAIWICDSDESARFIESRCLHADAKVISAPGYAADVLEIVMKDGLTGIVATTISEVPTERSSLSLIGEPPIANFLVNGQTLSALLTEAGGAEWSRSFVLPRGTALPELLLLTGRRIELVTEKSLVEKEGLLKRIHSSIQATGKLPDKQVLNSILNDMHTEADFSTVLSEIFDASLADLGEPRHPADVVSLASSLLQWAKPHGISVRQQCSVEECWGLLRASFDMGLFERTRAFWALRQWQRANSEYKLLRDWRVLDPFGVVWDQRYWETDLCFLSSDPALSLAVGIFKLDLDNFKGVNSALGHEGGDEAIRIYLQQVQAELGEIAEVYRRGGDEVIALAPATTQKALEARAEVLRSNIEHVFKEWALRNSLQQAPTASIGIAFAVELKHPEAILTAVNVAQERAKAGGKNRVEFVSAA